MRRGAVDTQIDGTLALTDWSFLPDNAVVRRRQLRRHAGRSPSAAGRYVLSDCAESSADNFTDTARARSPSITGLFDLADGDVYDVLFNRLRGQLTVTPDEVRIADAELRLFAPGKEVGPRRRHRHRNRRIPHARIAISPSIWSAPPFPWRISKNCRPRDSPSTGKSLSA